jgi:hypothetical protein
MVMISIEGLKYFCLQNNKMNESELNQVKMEDESFDREFKPRGAIAFFIVLVFLGMVIWYGIYFLMLDRV